MKVDITPTRHFIFVGVASVLILLVAIIIGATGPPVKDSTTYYAYGCPQNSHTWDPSVCRGAQLADDKQAWAHDVPTVTPLNRYWSLHFTPYTLQDTFVYPITRGLKIHVQIYGKNSPQLQVPYSLLSNETREEDITCKQGAQICDEILLVFDEEPEFTYYYVLVRVLNGGRLDGDLEPFLGDVKMEFKRTHQGFSTLELSIRIVFTFISAGVIFAALWVLRDSPVSDWAWEQRGLALLLFGLLGLNNPLFGFQFVARTWFFHFLDALFYTVFLGDFMIFALLAIDKIRLNETDIQFNGKHAIKLVVVGIFGILGVTLFTWVNIADRLDPVLSNSGSITGIQALYYINSIIFVGVLVWLTVLSIMTIPVARNFPLWRIRFLFIAIPTSVVVLSITIGIFTGTFGSVRATSLSVTYYYTLYNLYVWVLTWGYWPVEQRFSVRNPTETDALTGLRE